MSVDGRNLKYIYGLSTVGTKWIFCCYVVPQNRRRVTYQNFMTSRVIVNDIINGMVTKDFLEVMIRYIRGFLVVKQVDEIIGTAYETEVSFFRNFFGMKLIFYFIGQRELEENYWLVIFKKCHQLLIKQEN